MNIDPYLKIKLFRSRYIKPLTQSTRYLKVLSFCLLYFPALLLADGDGGGGRPPPGGGGDPTPISEPGTLLLFSLVAVVAGIAYSLRNKNDRK